MHYRCDRLRLEVDLLIDHGSALTAVEFKSGQTIADDWMQPLRRYQALAAERGAGAPQQRPPVVVYGGSGPRTRSGVTAYGCGGNGRSWRCGY